MFVMIVSCINTKMLWTSPGAIWYLLALILHFTSIWRRCPVKLITDLKHGKIKCCEVSEMSVSTAYIGQSFVEIDQNLGKGIHGT
jgi:hypothetical protein